MHELRSMCGPSELLNTLLYLFLSLCVDLNISCRIETERHMKVEALQPATRFTAIIQVNLHQSAPPVKNWMILLVRSSTKVDAQSMINWAVISPPSWQYLRARTIDRCSSSQWSSSFVFITVPSRGSISDRWYLCSYIMRAENKKNSSFDKDCLCFSSLCWCYATAGPVCDLPEKSKGLMEFCRMRSKGPIAGVRFLGGS